MDKRKSIGYEGIIAGFALFATFFGAGNLIFPPDIGLHTGNQSGSLPSFLMYLSQSL